MAKSSSAKASAYLRQNKGRKGLTSKQVRRVNKTDNRQSRSTTIYGTKVGKGRRRK